MSPSTITKVGVDRVAEITGLHVKVVRQLLEDGWTFEWDIQQNYKWTKRGPQDLMVLGQPTGSYPRKPPTRGPKGPAGDSGAN